MDEKNNDSLMQEITQWIVKNRLDLNKMDGILTRMGVVVTANAVVTALLALAVLLG